MVHVAAVCKLTFAITYLNYSCHLSLTVLTVERKYYGETGMQLLLLVLFHPVCHNLACMPVCCSLRVYSH